MLLPEPSKNYSPWTITPWSGQTYPAKSAGYVLSQITHVNPMTFIIEMSAVEASPDNGVLAITEVLYADWGDEFVELTNFSAAPVSIDGFRLRDSPDGTFVGLIDRFNYTFPATDEHGNSSDLAPGASAVLWLNSGGVGIENPPGRPADTREYRLDHFDQDLLNASADDLYLYDGSDLLVDYMQWGAVGGTHVADPPGEAYFEHAYRMEYIGAEDGQAIALAVNAGNEDRSGCWMLVPETGAPSNLTDISHRCPEAGVPRDLDPGTRRLSAGWTNMVL